MFLFTASSEGSSHGTQTLKGQASAYPAPSQIVVLHVTAVLLQAALCCIKLFFNMQILDKDTQSLVKSFRAIQNAVANLSPLHPPWQHSWNSCTTKCKYISIFWMTKIATEKSTCWDPRITRGSTTCLSGFPSFRAPTTIGLTPGTTQGEEQHSCSPAVCVELPHHRLWTRSWKGSAPQLKGDADRRNSYNTRWK